MAKKVLFVVNDPIAPQAMLGQAFDECGYGIEVFEVVPAACVDDPAFDVTFPDPRSYDAVVPLGARWSVNDGDRGLEWITSEVAMVRDAQATGVPMLGICFGGQLIAHALGGSVSRSSTPEIGWYDVDSRHADLIPPGPWFQWHFDRFSVPEEAVEVASNTNAAQAFVLGRTMGVQFHPELDEALLELWLVGEGADEIAALGLSADDLRSATAREVRGAAERVRALVRAFVDGVGSQRSARPS